MEAFGCQLNYEVKSFDGIPVFFDENRFSHAFFESSNRDGRKDQFSSTRSMRIDWIKETLENPNALTLKGWDKAKKKYTTGTRVNIVFGDFVVIISIRITRKGTLKGKFITCYVADNSIGKILKSPRWTKEAFLKEHKKSR